jgi:hypothetical protein
VPKGLHVHTALQHLNWALGGCQLACLELLLLLLLPWVDRQCCCQL